MKEETKQKLGTAKEFVKEHKSQIAIRLWLVGGYLIGSRIGNGIARIIK